MVISCLNLSQGLLRCAVVRWNYMHGLSHSSAQNVSFDSETFSIGFCFLCPLHTYPWHKQEECQGLLLRLLSLWRALSKLWPILPSHFSLSASIPCSPTTNLYIIIHILCNTVENPRCCVHSNPQKQLVFMHSGLTLLLYPCAYKTNILSLTLLLSLCSYKTNEHLDDYKVWNIRKLFYSD